MGSGNGLYDKGRLKEDRREGKVEKERQRALVWKLVFWLVKDSGKQKRGGGGDKKKRKKWKWSSVLDSCSSGGWSKQTKRLCQCLNCEIFPAKSRKLTLDVCMQEGQNDKSWQEDGILVTFGSFCFNFLMSNLSNVFMFVLWLSLWMAVSEKVFWKSIFKAEFRCQISD